MLMNFSVKHKYDYSFRLNHFLHFDYSFRLNHFLHLGINESYLLCVYNGPNDVLLQLFYAIVFYLSEQCQD
jgi:hypothetical protein